MIPQKVNYSQPSISTDSTNCISKPVFSGFAIGNPQIWNTVFNPRLLKPQMWNPQIRRTEFIEKNLCISGSVSSKWCLKVNCHQKFMKITYKFSSKKINKNRFFFQILNNNNHYLLTAYYVSGTMLNVAYVFLT